MPHSTREYLLRFADQAKNDLERASSNLQTMAEIYGEQKPDHAHFLLALVTALARLYELLDEFRKNRM